MSNNPYENIDIGNHCPKCGHPVIRGAMPYKVIDSKYYHTWCITEDSSKEDEELERKGVKPCLEKELE